MVGFVIRFRGTLNSLANIESAVLQLTEEAGLGTSISRFTEALNASAVTAGIIVEATQRQLTAYCGLQNAFATNFTAWSPCSITCGNRPGVQIRSRACPPQTETRSCAVPSCVSCAVNNGGCAPSATCSLNVNESISCTCPRTMVGNGITCSLRTQDQTSTLVGSVFFDGDLSAFSPSIQSQLQLQDSIRAALSQEIPVSIQRIHSHRIRPVNSSVFLYEFSVSVPIVLEDLTAEQIRSRINGGLSVVVTHGGSTIASRFIETDVVLDVATTASPSPAPSNVPTTASPTTTMPSVAPSIAPSSGTVDTIDTVESENNAAAFGSTGWDTQDTIDLLIAILATVIFMLVVFQIMYIRRKRANILMEYNGGRGISPVRDGWWASEAAGDNPNGQHYYPTSEAGNWQ